VLLKTNLSSSAFAGTIQHAAAHPGRSGLNADVLGGASRRLSQFAAAAEDPFQPGLCPHSLAIMYKMRVTCIQAFDSHTCLAVLVYSFELVVPAAASCPALDTIARQQGLTTFLAAAEVRTDQQYSACLACDLLGQVHPLPVGAHSQQMIRQS
jgi:hypothetical protein